MGSAVPGQAVLGSFPAVADVTPPELVLTSPPRGSFSAVRFVEVAGRVEERESGLAVLSVNGLPLSPDPAGSFSVRLPLSEGLNTVEVRAVDRAGNDVARHVAVLQGHFAPPRSPADRAAVLRLNDASIDAFEAPVSAALASAGLAGRIGAVNPVYRGATRAFGVCVASAEVNLLSAMHDPPRVFFEATPKGIEVSVVIPNLVVRAEAHQICGPPYSAVGTVAADEVRLVALAGIGVGPTGDLEVAIPAAAARMVNFRFHLGAIPRSLTAPVESMVRDRISDAIVGAVQRELPREMNRFLARLTSPVPVSIAGRAASVELTAGGIAFDDEGFTAVCTTRLVLPRSPAVGRSPGWLATPNPPPVVWPRPGFTFAVADDAVNQALHALWEGGMFHQALDARTLSSLGGAAAFSLDLSLLSGALPQLAALGPADTPVAIVFRPLLPPIFRVSGVPDLAELRVGDLLMDIYLEPVGGPRRLILTAALNLRLGISYAWRSQTLSPVMVTPPTILADIEEEPLMDLDDRDVAHVIAGLVSPLAHFYVNQFPGWPNPSLKGVAATQLAIQPDGPGRDWLSLTGDLR